MGFKSTQRTRMTYVTISKGHLVIKCEEGDEGAEPRKNKLDKIVYERHEEAFEGHITNVKIKESTNQYPDQLQVYVTDKKDKTSICIAMPVASNYATKFYSVMKAVDINSPVEFVPYSMPIDDKPGKTRDGWNLYQGGEKLTTTFDRDDIPAWVKKEEKVPGSKKTKTVWDNSDEVEFYLAHFAKWTKKCKFKDKEDEEDDEPEEKPKSSNKKRPVDDDDDEDEDTDDEDEEEVTQKKSKSKPAPNKSQRKKLEEDDDEVDF